MINTNVNIAGLKMKNPVIVASGTFGFGREYNDLIDLNKLGGISVKGLTLKPKEGNPPPRIAETPSGILNSVGLQNPGIAYFLQKELPFLRNYDIAIIANIAGNTEEEYCEMADIIGNQVDALELNISCPNVKEGGVAFGTNPATVYEITKKVKRYAKIPLIVKLSPNVTDIKEIAIAAEAGGADSLSLINTILGMAIDVNKRKPILANLVGGLSGPAIKPIAVRMVWQVNQAVNIPIIGMGGISNSDDAIEFMLAGADAISIGTANFTFPNVSIEVIDGISKYCLKNNIKKVTDIKNMLIE